MRTAFLRVLCALAVPERGHTSSQGCRGEQLPGGAGAHQCKGKRQRKDSLGVVRPVALRITKVRGTIHCLASQAILYRRTRCGTRLYGGTW